VDEDRVGAVIALNAGLGRLRRTCRRGEENASYREVQTKEGVKIMDVDRPKWFLSSSFPARYREKVVPELVLVR